MPAMERFKLDVLSAISIANLRLVQKDFEGFKNAVEGLRSYLYPFEIASPVTLEDARRYISSFLDDISLKVWYISPDEKKARIELCLSSLNEKEVIYFPDVLEFIEKIANDIITFISESEGKSSSKIVAQVIEEIKYLMIFKMYQDLAQKTVLAGKEIDIDVDLNEIFNLQIETEKGEEK